MTMSKFRTYKEFLVEGLDPSRFLNQEQIDWCDKHIEGVWGVNEKGEVTVPMKVEFKDKSFDHFPVQFAPVKGNFECHFFLKLTSLKGAPAHVKGSFSCDHCPELTSLDGAPSYVGDSFNCSLCPDLTSLEGAPAHVGGDFWCPDCNELTSLEGAPDYVGGQFDCNFCPHLTSLEGAPSHVGGDFNCYECPELPDSFMGITDDYNKGRIDWKQARKLIHSETGRKAHSIGLI
jgi:hypothetical protein